MTAVNFKDLTGQKFQYLTVLGRAEDIVFKNGKIKVRWNCICDCGNETVKYAAQLKHKTRVVSCGCKTPRSEGKYKLEGQVFGFLTVVKKSEEKMANRNFLWECSCECGNIVFASSNTLMKNEKKSCGCKTKAETSGTHGMHGTRTWQSWSSMIERCTKEYHKSYKYYKDVPVDPAWLDSFEAFYGDMGERPEGMTLDRIDSTKGYFKENCRWATNSTQQQNKLPNYINKNNGMAGVSKTGDRYSAKIRHDGIREHLGTFDTAEEASEAYNKRGYEIFGDLWVYKGPKPEDNE